MKVFLIGMLCSFAALAEADSRQAQFRERVRKVIEHNAGGTAGFAPIAARLALRRDPQWASRKLIEALEDPAGDMFWMFPVTAIAYLDQGQLTPEARKTLRNAWKTYMPYRGDTENHWLLYYPCLYPMAQLYPGEPASPGIRARVPLRICARRRGGSGIGWI